MTNLKARYSFMQSKPFDILAQQQQYATSEDKTPSIVVTPITPPASIKSTSVTPAHSVESSPKASFDNEAIPEVTVSRIDFAHETLPEYDDMYAVQIDNVLSKAECAELIRNAEASAGQKGWDRATVNVGKGQEAMYAETRKCGRIIWDSQATVDKIWERISELPEIQEIARLENNAHVTGNGPARRNEVWELTKPNERLRFLKYTEGEFFRPHCDGSYESPDRKERSYYTMHLYLNDAGLPSSRELRSMPREQRKAAQKNYLMGGHTAFHSYDGRRSFEVTPKAGSILIFQHRNLLHSGTDVLQGTKYTMRTDLMYRKA